MPQPQLLEKVLAVLDGNAIDYMITGSIVSSLQGEPRSTHDVDIVVSIKASNIPALLKIFLPPQYYISTEAIEEAIKFKSMFNLLDTTEGDKIDFWILTDDPFDKSRFQRKYEEDAFGFKMKVSTPEDTILAKLRWAKLAGGSEKQFTDALRVFEVQHDRLDISYLETWAANLGVEEMWHKIKQQADPIT
jgi:hypothetical protein